MGCRAGWSEILQLRARASLGVDGSYMGIGGESAGLRSISRTLKSVPR